MDARSRRRYSADASLPIWVLFDGQEYPCRLQADFIGNERILGRDVLNRLEMLFAAQLVKLSSIHDRS